jgi:hypothetical protein
MSDIVAEHMAIIRNITPQAPISLDDVIGQVAAPSVDVVPQLKDVALPSKALWTRSEDEVSFIGIRISSPIESLEQMAMGLSAIAVERQVVPIFISWIGGCGLQSYGLRVEHVTGADDAEKLAVEEQLMRLWNLAIVIDAKDVAAF